MAVNVIAAIRHAKQLRGNVKFTALEVGHRLNKSGYGHVSYQFLSFKTGSSRRTVIRHMHKLTAMHIFQKTVYRTANGYAINLYKCLLPIPAFYRATPAMAHSDSLTPMLPEARGGDAKELSLAEEIRLQRKGLQFLSEGSPIYQACLEKIAALEVMQRPG
jgi:hypothetical protein